MTDDLGAVGTNDAQVATTVSQQQAASEVGTREAVRSLAATLSPDMETTAHLIKGVVTAVNLHAIPRTLSAQLEGDTTTTVDDIGFIHSYTPVVGDTVQIIKQGSSVLAIGQTSIAASTPAQDGWIAPTLASGVTTNAFDPVRYRVIVDNGARKIQLRGGVNLNASQTVLWTMPTEIRPVVNMTPLLCARDELGGSNTVSMSPQANGNMLLSAVTTGVKPVSVVTTLTVSGALPDSITDSATVNIGHDHDWLNTDPNSGNPDAYRQNGIAGPDHITGTGHTHGMGHDHDLTNPVGAVLHPDWVSFNGVEYFL